MLTGQRGNYKIHVKYEKDGIYHAVLTDARTSGVFSLPMDCKGAIDAISVAMHVIDTYLTPCSVIIEARPEPPVDDDLAAQVNKVLDGTGGSDG